MKKLLESWNKFVVEQKGMPCPAPTQDLELNTENRDAAIQAEHIPLCPIFYLRITPTFICHKFILH